MIFKIEDPNTGRQHHIIGTMHVGNKDAYTYIDGVNKIMKFASCYAAEMDLDAAASADLSASYGLPNGAQLSDYYNPQLYARIAKITLKTYGIQLDDFKYYKPILLLNMLGEQSIVKDSRPALDRYIWNLAKDHSLETTGVENVERQREILNSIPLSYQLKALRKACRRMDKYGRSVQKMSKTYASGDYQKLYRLTSQSMGGIRDLMIHKRNNNMVNRITTLMRQHRHLFVGVGAGHIGGNSGIRAQLLRAGFKVKYIG